MIGILLIFFWLEPMTKDSICMERGHIKSDVVFMTDMATYEEIVDEENRTIKIIYNDNYRTYHCQRCGKMITEKVQEHPCTLIIWRRPPDTLAPFYGIQLTPLKEAK